ncbi:hypothetical protein ACQJBY_033181 [Aegilops geniculata]
MRLPPPATHRRRRRLWIQRRASRSREQNLARTPAFGPPSEGRALTPSYLAQDGRTASHGGVDPLAWLASIHRRRGFYLAAWHVGQHSLPSLQSSSSTHLSFLQVALICTVLPTLSCINKEARCFSFSPRPVASPPEANTFKKTTISALIQRWKCAETHRPSPNCPDSDPTPSQSSPLASGRSRPSRTEVHYRR